ncbi:MAG TPA: O-antigen ligase family protein [Candidatus Binatia bacterium]|nr:O-antigen ligase family protein [Candidatus Binatia bacterium]
MVQRCKAWSFGVREAISCHSCVSCLKQNRLPLIAIALSVFVVGFWQLRFSKFQFAQRIVSVANPNDFSWRNRVSAWQGATRMMIDKPLTGFGWGKAESVYAKRFCTTASNESAAIEMNDYLMLGISGGVPVMLCFIGYVALAFRRPHLTPALSPPAGSGEGIVESLVSRHLLLQTTCRAGAIMLLVGFWFDGGLFKLPTAVVFWTLLELSRLEFTLPKTGSISVAGKQSSLSANYGKPNRWLSRAAWCAMIAAAGVSAFYLFTPYLVVSGKTIAIARHYLILPKERADFDFLASQRIWQGQKLKNLLDHAELSNYNRELINWKLDDRTYRDYVLSPLISPSTNDSQLSTGPNWRRPLWEEFYPRIRHENSPADAAQIVVRHLRERVTIAGLPNPPHSVLAIWRRQITDGKGFQIIYVAALRSVGVPARLDANGQAEFYDGNQWRPAPKPAVD